MRSIMKFLLNSSLALILATSLSGCIVIGDRDNWNDNDWEKTQQKNREIISDLQLNSELKSVRLKLGAPNFSEAFTHSGETFRVLYYRTQHRHSDGDTTKDETTPLVFKNDKLIGWGNDALTKLKN
jgi:outer membrane protein assembly factor BamE (lipoprotein component of BamABCDE complex)